jgi:uncharacterized protein YjbI with pentapeptide repeats
LTGVSFKDAKFTGGLVVFEGVEFTGVSFDGAEFAGSGVSFGGAKFTSGDSYFARAKFTDGKIFFTGTVSLSRAEFSTSNNIIWGPFESPAAWTELQEKERRHRQLPP